jgi:hypothetical protein
MSFITRKLKLTFTLGTGSFGESGSATVVVSDLRISATIVKAGLNSMPQAQLAIYGLTLSVMNQLSTLGAYQIIAYQRNNTVKVEAGDDNGNLTLVFTGTIFAAYADLSQPTEAPFIVYAMTGLLDQTKPVPPTSYKGSVSVATVINTLATLMGVSFENNGVTTQISNPYLAGTARQQVIRCVEAANIEWNGADNGVLAIWPKGGTRGGVVTTVSAQAGLVGYPGYSDYGPLVTVIFTPGIAFGGQLKLTSSITPASGTWWVAAVTHRLESQTPGGAWFSDITCSKFNLSTGTAVQ